MLKIRNASERNQRKPEQKNSVVMNGKKPTATTTTKNSILSKPLYDLE